MVTAGSSWAGVITATASLVTSIGGLVVTFKVFIPNLRVSRSTHQIVNSERTEMRQYIRDLIADQIAAGQPVTVDQSVRGEVNDG